MTSEVRQAIETPDGWFEFAPHNCFACGSKNLNGLRLVHHVEPGRSWAELVVDDRFEGWAGILHGGIVSTILDEVMAWALVGSDNWGVTARMSIEFRRPVEVGTAIRAEGWITRDRRRIVETAGRIVDVAAGDELATATGVYVAADQATKRVLMERYAFRPVGTADPAGAVDTVAR